MLDAIPSAAPVDEAKIVVSLLSGQWAAAWFPGPPGYEDGYCVLEYVSGSWKIVFGIQNKSWSTADEMVSQMKLRGVPENLAKQLATDPAWK